MTRFALYVELKAKPGREEVATLLANARPRHGGDRHNRIAAVRFDKETFAICDAFNDEAGRTAHLNGAVAAALMANAADLLAAVPETRQPAVLADKLPTGGTRWISVTPNCRTCRGGTSR